MISYFSLVVLATIKSLNITQCALVIMFKNMMLSHQQRDGPFKSIFLFLLLEKLPLLTLFANT